VPEAGVESTRYMRDFACCYVRACESTWSTDGYFYTPMQNNAESRKKSVCKCVRKAANIFAFLEMALAFVRRPATERLFPK
jgi:hypothetical protein